MAFDANETSATQPQAIQDDGDVIFEVGHEHEFQVSSLVMKNASKVFKAMLSSGFSEGEMLRESGQVRIPLPEDDVDGMFAILCVLHGKNKRLPKRLSPKAVYDVAVLADKYDLNTPLKFAAEHWLDPPDVKDDDGLWLLTKAAYLFECGKAFSELTKRLLLYHDGSYQVLMAAQDEFDGVEAARICCESTAEVLTITHLSNVLSF